MSHFRPAMSASRALVICGLGVHPPLETLVETLLALEECRVVYTDVRDEAVFAWLKGYCRSLKRTRSAKAVLAAAHALQRTSRWSAVRRRSRAAARGGAVVGLAVWGHPQLTSRLAREVERRARAEGLAYEVLAAISPIASVFCRALAFFGDDYGYKGLRVAALEDLLAGEGDLPSPRPLAVFAEAGSPADWKRMALRLGETYGESHELRLYALGGARELVLRACDLASAPPKGGVLFVAPAGSAERSAR